MGGNNALRYHRMMAAEEPERIELDIPESFHRIKRTLLLLCGTLVLLGSASPEVVRDLTPAAPLIEPSLTAIRALTLISAAYYAWGFLHEFLAARRRNRHLLDPAKLRDLESQLNALTARLGQFADEVASVPVELRQGVQNSISDLDSARTFLVKKPKDLLMNIFTIDGTTK